MAFWYLLILIVSLIGVRLRREGFFPDFLGKEQCKAVKGFFILLVFLGHAIISIRNCGFSSDRMIDRLAFRIWSEMGQLVVVMFFFYSGYGVMSSLRTKGLKYLESYPQNRLLTTLVNFDIAVFCYLLLNWALGIRAGFSKVALSMIGWESVGNSNWFIFVILFCYLAFYLAFWVVRNNDLVGSMLVVMLVFAGMLALHRFKGNTYWYDTMLVFPVGVFYALYAEKITEAIQKHYWWTLAFLAGVFLVLHFGHIRSFHGLTLNIKAIVFSLLIVVLTMKVQVGNPWLLWCGLSLFPLYIYQRLPMLAIRGLAGKEWVCTNPHVFIGICFMVTVGIALLYNKWLRLKIV